MLKGWQRYKNSPDPRIRERFARQVKKLIHVYNAALWVMEREFKQVNASVSEQIHKLRREVEKEFPVIARLTAISLGPILLWTTRREERRLASGRTYEPPTFVERRNWMPASQPVRSRAIPDDVRSSQWQTSNVLRVLPTGSHSSGT